MLFRVIRERPFITLSVSESLGVALVVVAATTLIGQLWGAYVTERLAVDRCRSDLDGAREGKRDAFGAIGAALAVTSQVACVWAPPLVYLREADGWRAVELGPAEWTSDLLLEHGGCLEQQR